MEISAVDSSEVHGSSSTVHRSVVRQWNALNANVFVIFAWIRRGTVANVIAIVNG